MGKFDGLLFISDYDNTITYTQASLLGGEEPPPISRENRRAIEYFMAQGGVFSVATGRALPAFVPIASAIPMNGPTILFNGAAIYDFTAGRYLHTAFLPDSVLEHLALLLDRFPGLAMEIYHDDTVIHTLRPNEITRQHLRMTHPPKVIEAAPDRVPAPVSKVLLEGPDPLLEQVTAYLRSADWSDAYEIVSSAACLVELTARGANKGAMAEKLASLLGVPRRNVLCAGDQANDIPMLRFAAVPCAPANAIPAVHRLPGIRILPHCRDHAIAAMIQALDRQYGSPAGPVSLASE